MATSVATSGGHGNLGGNLDVITTLGGNLVGNLGQASAAGPEVTADRHGSARRISVVPGQNRAGALLDVARTVVRRAERQSVGTAARGSLAVAYLNRLSDLLWTMARWQEGVSLPARPNRPNRPEGS